MATAILHTIAPTRASTNSDANGDGDGNAGVGLSEEEEGGEFEFGEAREFNVYHHLDVLSFLLETTSRPTGSTDPKDSTDPTDPTDAAAKLAASLTSGGATPAAADADATQQFCTYVKTGGEFQKQHWYNCYTCGLSWDKGCCSVCVVSW